MRLLKFGGNLMLEDLPLALNSSESFLRRMKILQLLSLHPEGLASKDLADACQSTKPTILNDIEKLKLDLPNEYVQLRKTSRGPICLKYLLPVSVEVLITLFMQKTTVFHIMEDCLHHRLFSVTKMEERLYISRSTFFDTVKHMNHVLKDFRVQIGTNPVSFIGKEEDIRYVCLIFFRYFGDSTLLLPDSDQMTQALIKQYHQYVEKPLHFNHYQVSVFLSIAILRWRKKQYIQLSPQKEVELSSYVDGDMLNQWLPSFYQAYGGTLPSREVLWFAIAILQQISYSDAYDHNEVKTSYAFHRQEQLTKQRAEIDTFFKKVFSEKKTINTKKMEAFLLNNICLSKLSDHYQQVRPTIRDLVLTTHRNVYKLYLDNLHQVPKGSSLDFSHKEDIAVTLTFLHLDAFRALNSERKKVYALFAFWGGNGLDQYLTNVCKDVLPKDVVTDFFYDRVITYETALKRKPDLIVCNYNLVDLHQIRRDCCPVIRISTIPTMVDWAIVRDTLISLQKPQEDLMKYMDIFPLHF